MKRIITIISSLVVALSALTSCGDYEYYEPAFFDDTIDWTIPAIGGEFPVQYKYIWFDETKTIHREFDFEYRVIIDGVASPSMQPKDARREYIDGEPVYTFYVSIPKNTTGHPRAILIEASTEIDLDGDEYDRWSDWFPVISTVQLAI